MRPKYVVILNRDEIEDVKKCEKKINQYHLLRKLWSPTYTTRALFMWKVVVILLLPMFSEAPRGASPKQFSMVYGKGGGG